MNRIVCLTVWTLTWVGAVQFILAVGLGALLENRLSARLRRRGLKGPGGWELSPEEVEELRSRPGYANGQRTSQGYATVNLDGDGRGVGVGCPQCGGQVEHVERDDAPWGCGKCGRRWETHELRRTNL